MGKLKAILKNNFNGYFQISLFIFCLLSSLFLYSFLESLNDSTNNYININSKEVIGGDITISSRSPFTSSLLEKLELLEEENKAKVSFLYELTTITYSNKSDKSLLTSLKIVDDNYPLYGELSLLSNKNFSSINKTQKVFLKKNSLEQLNLKIGDSIKIGNSTFEIYGLITNEPDESFDFVSLGEKMIITNALDTNLLTNKSRVSFKAYLKLDNQINIDGLKNELKIIGGDKIRVETFEEERDDLNGFINRFLSFFKIILFFLLILFGVGINTTISSFIQKKEKSIAIMKTLGEKNITIRNLVLKIILSIFLICFILNFVLLDFFLNYININFKEFLPKDLLLEINYILVLKCFFIFLSFTLLSVLIPLILLGNIKPNLILKKEKINVSIKKQLSILVLIFCVFMTFSIIELKSFFYGVSFSLSSLLVILIIYFLTKLILNFLKDKKKYFSFPQKQAISNMNRIGSKTNIFIVIISICLILIFSIVLIQKNIEKGFIQNYPENSPNLFLVDVKEEDILGLEKIINKPFDTFPIIRAPILSINDKSIKEISKEIEFERRATRDFSLTYYDTILDSEKIIKTRANDGMFFENKLESGLFQVSVLDEIAGVIGIKIDDTIIFLIQGVEVKAKVVSLRQRLENTISPYFYFVFKRDELENAPKTIYITTSLEKDKISKVQKKVVEKFPYITSINVFEIVEKVSNTLNKLFLVVILFTIIGIVVGFIILVSSLLSENSKRLEEISFYKVLGSSKAFILKTIFYEYFFIGIITALIGIVFSNLISFYILEFFLNLKFYFLFDLNIFFLLVSTLVVVVFGMIFSFNIINKKPTKYLKENTIE